MLGHLFIKTGKNAISFLPLIAIIISGCGPRKDGSALIEKFPVTHPSVVDTVVTTEYVADIHSVQNVELRARVSGFLEKIFVDEGAEVQAGQLLFRISDQQHQQDLLKAKAATASALADSKVAEVDVINARTLVEKNVISKTELEMAEAKWDAARAKVEEARAQEESAVIQLSYTEVRAPFSGIINRIPNKSGSLLEEGELLTTLSDNSEVFAYFNVSESDYLQLIKERIHEKNYTVELVMANHRSHPYGGLIETVEGEVDKATGNIAFRARFRNPELILKHGSTGKVKLKRMVKDALVIPQKATFEIQDNLYVYVIDQQNTIRLRTIEPAFRLPHLYIIESGVHPNDLILLEGIQRVKEGDRVETELVSMNTILGQVSKL